MQSIDAETLGLLARALDRDEPEHSPDGRAPGDAWLMSELAARLDSARSAHDAPPCHAALRLAQRLARRTRADLRDLLASPRPEAQAVRVHLGLDGDEVLPAITRALTGGLALRAEVAAVLAAMILRETGQTTLPDLSTALQAQGRRGDPRG